MGLDYDLEKKALAFAREKHKGQKDKAGADYINHPIAVAAQVDEGIFKAVAYLHDVMEDCGVSEEELRGYGFPDEVVDRVRMLTHDVGTEYLEYVKRLAHDPVARAVKMADLRHNMDMSRIPNPNERDFKRLERYKKAYAILENANK